MRYKHGYVCLVKFLNANLELMFGQNAGSCSPEVHYENFETSNLALFLTPKEVLRAKSELLTRQDFSEATVKIAGIKLLFAETAEELTEFMGADNLVVIVRDPDCPWYRTLIGRLVESAAEGVMPGSRLVRNGFQYVISFDSAMHIIRQWNRQGKSPATIGQFFIKRL